MESQKARLTKMITHFLAKAPVETVVADIGPTSVPIVLSLHGTIKKMLADQLTNDRAFLDVIRSKEWPSEEK